MTSKSVFLKRYPIVLYIEKYLLIIILVLNAKRNTFWKAGCVKWVKFKDVCSTPIKKTVLFVKRIWDMLLSE